MDAVQPPSQAGGQTRPPGGQGCVRGGGKEESGSLEEWGLEAHRQNQALGVCSAEAREDGGLQQLWAQLGSLVVRKVQSSHRIVSQQPPPVRFTFHSWQGSQVSEFSIAHKAKDFHLLWISDIPCDVVGPAGTLLSGVCSSGLPSFVYFLQVGCLHFYL